MTLRGRVSQNAINTMLDNVTQWTREGSASLQIPISSSAGRFKSLGDLNIGIEKSFSRTSRVGAITNAKYSLQWQSATWLRLAGSIAKGRTPPSVELKSGPIIATPGMRYLDPLIGNTIDVVSLTGGNPALSTQRGNNQRLSLELRPLVSIPVLFTADYANSRDSDIITTLPTGNNLLLLAFPERFVRDGNGRLVSVDTRPLNFARQSEEQILYGLEFTVPFGSKKASASDVQETVNNRLALGTSRLRFNISHTILLKSEVLVSTGFAPVDLLSRNAFSFSSGERPRHELNFGADYAARGLGVQFNGQYMGQSFVNLTGGSAPNILRFSPLATLNVRAFIEGKRLLPLAFWLKSTRLSLLITNIGNERQKVGDASGVTPLFYQAAYRDPTGRSVTVELRKVF